MARNCKRILDSVHGYIKIRSFIFEHIIDTPNFQRLRRIEQTSARALFPSARHDRFIHSLGVFHLGEKILSAIERTRDAKTFQDKSRIFTSYSTACLLHDVGHSPFSHTFEKYFDNERHCLIEMLKVEIGNQEFSEDADQSLSEAAPHEIMSAYISMKVYKECFVRIGADPELVCRMIIGCKYREREEHCSLENAFIDLIHGDIIDADGLDYVCRDTWASGYSTARVDINRLIESIIIKKDEKNRYTVCFSPKCLNEIEAVLSVKTFQQTNVITHHTIVYEQHLLVKAMESAALYHFNLEYTEDENERDKALSMLCDVNAMLEIQILPKFNTPFYMPMDDDFVALMKYIPDDRYVKQWMSRRYNLRPLWKSKAEFFEMFGLLIGKKYSKRCWLFSDSCKQFISEQMGIPLLDIWILDAQDKYKGNKASKIKLFVNNKILSYDKLFSNDKNSYNPDIQPFYHIYVPKSLPVGVSHQMIIELLKNEVCKYIFS